MAEHESSEHVHSSPCESDEASYDHRVYNEDQYNFCSVPEKGFDAILFVAIGVTVTCLAPRKHYAIVMLILGALLQLLNVHVNIRELSNALNVWIGIRPAKLFFYIFLPPLLLDSAVRIDFFIFKKVMVQVFVFAFVVVSANTVLLAVFMLYVLNLRNEGWEWTDAFLFACMIASTDALAVTAIMKDGSGPESLVVLAEGESLFNDATSIVFFDLFWPRFKDSIAGTLKHEPLLKIIGKMALDVGRLAVGGAAIGILGGFITQQLFRFLQNRSGHSPVGEVGVTVGMSYFCYYVAESVCEFSGVIAVVVYGLYGAATTQWDISPEARESRVFSGFWDVTQLLTNGLVFFYAGASATNFFYRCEEHLFHGDDADAWSTIFAWLPAVYVGIFLLRFLEIAAVTPLIGLMGARLKLNEIVFIALAGLRGALALILAQELLQYEFEEGKDFHQERKVRAQSALWVCGFVLLTLLINAPGIPFLMKLCGLEELTPMQLKYRKKADKMLEKHTEREIEIMKVQNYGIVCGVNWMQVQDFLVAPEVLYEDLNVIYKAKNIIHDGAVGIQHAGLALFESLSNKAPLVPHTVGDPLERPSLDLQYKEGQQAEAPLSGTSTVAVPALGESEVGKKAKPIISTGPSAKDLQDLDAGLKVLTNEVLLVSQLDREWQLIEQSAPLPQKFQRFMENRSHPFHHKNQRFFKSSSSYFNLIRDSALPEKDVVDDNNGQKKVLLSHQISIFPRTVSSEGSVFAETPIGVPLLNPTASDMEDDQEASRNRMLTEGRFRCLMGLKKYFEKRRTEGYLSSRGLRLLIWACDVGMEEPHHPLNLWELIENDIQDRIQIKVASKVRDFLRKTALAFTRWPRFIQIMFAPMLNGISMLLGYVLTWELVVAIESAVECWLALGEFRSHSSELMDSEGTVAMEAEVETQQELVWKFLLAREVEAPERFQAVQTFRAKRALLQGQIGFVDVMFDHGYLEENEHEHLTKDLSLKRASLLQKGPVRGDFEVEEFLRNMPFFMNISDEVFRNLIRCFQVSTFNDKDLIAVDESSSRAPGSQLETFSFHIVINGLLKSEFKDQGGRPQEYHLGQGGVYGLLSALSGERPSWMGTASAELNGFGQGPCVVTVPHSVLEKIHAEAKNGNHQYQQLELDLHRVAALYVVQFLQNRYLHLTTSLQCAQSGEDMVEGCVKTLQGGQIGLVEKLRREGKLNEKLEKSREQSMELLNEVKQGISNGSLVLIPPASSFVQEASAVLLIGTLFPEKAEGVKLEAPVLIPWMKSEVTGVVKYKSGSHGAIVVTCPATSDGGPGGSSSARAEDEGLRIGGDAMAPLPPAAASMMNEFIK